jgi:predicted acylesterase/phospholipase RssA
MTARPLIALAMQGGGALGAYQFGVYAELSEGRGWSPTGYAASPSAR